MDKKTYLAIFGSTCPVALYCRITLHVVLRFFLGVVDNMLDNNYTKALKRCKKAERDLQGLHPYKTADKLLTCTYQENPYPLTTNKKVGRWGESSRNSRNSRTWPIEQLELKKVG